jgi:hypothetical protein
MFEETEPKRTIKPAQWWVIALVVACTCAALFYRIFINRGLGHSSAMFLGVPAVLAILLALTPKARTVTGGIVKGVTLALLIVAPLLGEGYLCILFASPLFYLVGILVGIGVDTFRRNRGTTLTCIAVALLPLCMEGVAPQLTWNRAQSVAVTRVIPAPVAAVEASLSQSPRVGTALPRFLRIGFPRPLEARGHGLSLGATRTIHFAGAEGDPPGDLVMRIAERRSGYARFETVSDDSKLTQWVRWDDSEVEWAPVDGGHTRVTWCIHFERQLDPAWYFVPWERAAVRATATFLIAANATPEGLAK